MQEFVDCLRGLWTGESVNYQGQFFLLAGARLAFRPPQALVIYLAAMGEQMLRLCGRTADGVVLSAGLSPAYCRTSFDLVRTGAINAGRDPASLRRAAFILFAVSADGRTAVELVRAKLAFLLRNRALSANIAETGLQVDQERIMDAISRRSFDEAASLVSDEAVEAFSVCGTPKACQDRLQAFLDAGVTEPVLMVQGAERERDLALAFLRTQTPQ